MASLKIIELAEKHSHTDYAETRSVAEANEISDQINSIIESMISAGETKDLLELLNHESAGAWVGFNIVEVASLSKKQKERAVMKIKQLSKGNDVNAFGAESWLNEHGY